jgi:hypothetical protein
MNIDSNIQDAFAGLIGLQCCRQRVGRWGSLSLGFGGRVPHLKRNAVDTFYGEWELGTYSSAWRIVQHGQVVCGSLDAINSIEKLDGLLQTVKLGAVMGVEALSEFDIRILLNEGVHIDFMCASSDDDEMFHIFGPESIYVEYKCLGGWNVGKSDVPWA